jgi:hypothetical protein
MTTTTTTNIELPDGATIEVPARFYPTAPDFRRIRNGWEDVPGGTYADHQDIRVAAVAFQWRRTGLTYQQVADRCHIQTFRMAEQAVARYCRTYRTDTPRTYRRTRRTTAPTARRYGIEIEFNAGYGGGYLRQQIVAELQARGIDAVLEHYNHDVRPHWKMTTDATVTGGELVSPVMDGTPESIEQVLEVIRTVKQCGGTTGRNVGMHVHHDVTDYTQEDMMRLVRTLQCVEDALCAYVPAHRHDGSSGYGARRIHATDWNRLSAAISGGHLLPQNARRTAGNRSSGCPVSRYSSINWNSVLTYGTVEIRLLGHTLNTVKVQTWLEVTTAIFRAVKAGHELTAYTNATDMVAWLQENGGLSARSATRYQDTVAARNPAMAAA